MTKEELEAIRWEAAKDYRKYPPEARALLAHIDELTAELSAEKCGRHTINGLYCDAVLGRDVAQKERDVAIAAKEKAEAERLVTHTLGHHETWRCEEWRQELQVRAEKAEAERDQLRERLEEVARSASESSPLPRL